MAAACPVPQMASNGSVSASVVEERRQARLRQLIDDHFASVWKFLRRIGVPAHLAEDASQEVFLVAARRVDDITARHAAERSFLLGTAYRVARELQRKAHRESLEIDVDAECGPALNPEEQLDEKRASEVVYRLLSELDEDVRHIFVMYEMDGMTMIEIAKLLELPIGTVGSRLRRAREDFKARFERHRKRLVEVR
jgi:RNA polymerase sigma-70 factor, ECF subfamily